MPSSQVAMVVCTEQCLISIYNLQTFFAIPRALATICMPLNLFEHPIPYLQALRLLDIIYITGLPFLLNVSTWQRILFLIPLSVLDTIAILTRQLSRVQRTLDLVNQLIYHNMNISTSWGSIGPFKISCWHVLELSAYIQTSPFLAFSLSI